MTRVYKILIKLFALFSVVRGYNLILLALAQYLAALFIFSRKQSHIATLLDPKLTGIIVASALSVAAGFIINNFYDLERDQISKPLQSYIQRYITQDFKLRIYLIINSLAALVALLVSWRVFAFFLFYQIGVWLYSHKINKILFLNNLTYITLKITPFFALLIYYQNFAPVIFLYAVFLGLLLLISDIIKDFITLTADSILGYKTLPLIWGKSQTRILLVALCITAIFINVYLVLNFPLKLMTYYFLLVDIVFILLIFRFLKPATPTTYKIILWLFRLLFVVGVLSIVLLEYNPIAVLEYLE